MSDSVIVIEIDYEPTFSSYPPGITTKRAAMEADVDAYHDGTFGLIDLIQFGDAADVRVERRE